MAVQLSHLGASRAWHCTSKPRTARRSATLRLKRWLISSRDETVAFDVGELSKQRDAWVLVTHVRDGARLQGYGFCTLERVRRRPQRCLSGSPGFVATSRRDSVLRSMMGDQFRRAVLAFPDEDVLVACQMADPAAFRCFQDPRSCCTPARLRGER